MIRKKYILKWGNLEVIKKKKKGQPSGKNLKVKNYKRTTKRQQPQSKKKKIEKDRLV